METTKRAREEVRWEDMLFLLLISGAALLTRFYLFPIESNDYHQFLQKWFATLKENGGLAATSISRRPKTAFCTLHSFWIWN